MEILPITNTATTMTTKIIHISFTTDNASTKQTNLNMIGKRPNLG